MEVLKPKLIGPILSESVVANPGIVERSRAILPLGDAGKISSPEITWVILVTVKSSNDDASSKVF